MVAIIDSYIALEEADILKLTPKSRTVLFVSFHDILLLRFRENAQFMKIESIPAFCFVLMCYNTFQV